MTASAYRVISKEVENQIFRHNWIFRHTYVYKQSTLIKYYNYIFVQIYTYFRYTDRVFLGCVLFVVVTSQLYEKQRRNKDWVTEESTERNLCEALHFFDCMPSFLCHFLLPSSSTTLPKWRTYWMASTKAHIAMGGILCDVENMMPWCHFPVFPGYFQKICCFPVFPASVDTLWKTLQNSLKSMRWNSFQFFQFCWNIFEILWKIKTISSI